MINVTMDGFTLASALIELRNKSMRPDLDREVDDLLERLQRAGITVRSKEGWRLNRIRFIVSPS